MFTVATRFRWKLLLTHAQAAGIRHLKTLLILSKYTKHVAVRKWNILFWVYSVWAQAEIKKIEPLMINLFRTFGETWVSEHVRLCARFCWRFLYVLLLELSRKSSIVFSVSNNVERTYNILIAFVQLGVPCRNCTISKTCIFILKVDTKVSNSGDSLPLSLPNWTL